MQCGAKMNMVTFSAFEKQICNILHLLHNFRIHAGADNRARRVKNTPARPSKPPRNTPPCEPPSNPGIKRRNALNSALKTLWSLPPESSTDITYLLNTYD